MKKHLALLLIIILLLSGCTSNKPQHITPESAKFAPPTCVFYYKVNSYISFITPEGYDSYFTDVQLLPTDDTVDVTELKTIGSDYPDDYEPISFTGKVYIPQNDNYSDIVFVKNEATNVFYPFTIQKTPTPTTVQTSQLCSGNNIFDYNGQTYSGFYEQYGYKYYLGDEIHLFPTGDTVKVDEWVTCGTGLPDNYDPFIFNGEVYMLENDSFGGEIIFVRKDDNEFYPFRCHVNVPYDQNDTVRDYFNKRYGEGSFDNITEVRLSQQYVIKEWYELPEDIRVSLLSELKNTSATGGVCSCTSYQQTYNHRDLRLCLPITRFEHTLTLCSVTSTVNGHKISKSLCDSLMSCIDMKYYKKYTP